MRIFISQRKLLWIVLGVIVLSLLSYWGLHAAADAIFSSTPTTPTAQEYSDWVKLEIPSTAQNWKAYGEGFMDWYVQARFEIKPEELASFLQKNNLERIHLNQPPENALKQSWFNPKAPLEVYQLISSQTQQASTASGFYPTVYVERNDPTIVVYIIAFNT